MRIHHEDRDQGGETSILQQLRCMVRLANQPPARFIGDEGLDPEPEEPVHDEEEDQETQAV